MIVPDVNLVIYAHDAKSPWHLAARSWWQTTLNGTEPVGIAPLVALGFVRILSNPKLAESPVDPGALAAIAARWFDRPMVRALGPGPEHWNTLSRLLTVANGTSALVSDAHLAALAIDLGATLYSNDTDFQRFEGLKLVNPLRPSANA